MAVSVTQIPILVVIKQFILGLSLRIKETPKGTHLVYKMRKLNALPNIKRLVDHFSKYILMYLNAYGWKTVMSQSYQSNMSQKYYKCFPTNSISVLKLGHFLRNKKTSNALLLKIEDKNEFMRICFSF